MAEGLDPDTDTLQGLRARFQLPIGAIVHPLAEPQDVPIINLDSPGIVRCRRCRTYINPFVTWQDGGRCISNWAPWAASHRQSKFARLWS